MVPHSEFVKWLGKVQAENAEFVVNAREVGLVCPDTLYVGRAMVRNSQWSGIQEFPGTWGNPYRETQYGRIECIRMFVKMLRRMPEDELIEFLRPIREALDEGKKLMCWCAPLVCHAHVLAGWARAMNFPEVREGAVQASTTDAPAPSLDTTHAPKAPTETLVDTTTTGSRFASSRA